MRRLPLFSLSLLTTPFPETHKAGIGSEEIYEARERLTESCFTPSSELAMKTAPKLLFSSVSASYSKTHYQLRTPSKRNCLACCRGFHEYS